LTAPNFWHRHYGKTSAFWALAFLIPFTEEFGFGSATRAIVHSLLAEYIPFIVLLLALFTVAGGIHIRSHVRATPMINTGILALGAVLASIMGTTGASMLLIRPLITANAGRHHKAHVVVFFIFLVANIGGALTPLGDPPLFLGFLKGVDFFWTTQAMAMPTLTAAVLLLGIFYAIDRWYFSHPNEMQQLPVDLGDKQPVTIQGKFNFLLLGGILAAVLLSGVWNSELELNVAGTVLQLQDVVRDVALLAIAWISWKVTPPSVRAAHHFEWGPIIEVAKLFAAIFLTIIPAIAILRAGRDGFLAPIVTMVSHADGQPNDMMYFWLTGSLSSVLDNAPTYLVFFNLAGGDAADLMSRLASTLTAISAGAVYMGAMTYIGNAPNFMVKSIAESRGVPMPSFVSYIGWSAAILLPVFVFISYLYF
jgi:Na+/H+ antiporter NhaD/arsenite permease-like protein